MNKVCVYIYSYKHTFTQEDVETWIQICDDSEAAGPLALYEWGLYYNLNVVLLY